MVMLTTPLRYTFMKTAAVSLTPVFTTGKASDKRYTEVAIRLLEIVRFGDHAATLWVDSGANGSYTLTSHKSDSAKAVHFKTDYLPNLETLCKTHIDTLRKEIFQLGQKKHGNVQRAANKLEIKKREEAIARLKKTIVEQKEAKRVLIRDLEDFIRSPKEKLGRNWASTFWSTLQLTAGAIEFYTHIQDHRLDSSTDDEPPTPQTPPTEFSFSTLSKAAALAVVALGSSVKTSILLAVLLGDASAETVAQTGACEADGTCREPLKKVIHHEKSFPKICMRPPSSFANPIDLNPAHFVQEYVRGCPVGKPNVPTCIGLSAQWISQQVLKRPASVFFNYSLDLGHLGTSQWRVEFLSYLGYEKGKDKTQPFIVFFGNEDHGAVLDPKHNIVMHQVHGECQVPGQPNVFTLSSIITKDTESGGQFGSRSPLSYKIAKNTNKPFTDKDIPGLDLSDPKTLLRLGETVRALQTANTKPGKALDQSNLIIPKLIQRYQAVSEGSLDKAVYRARMILSLAIIDLGKGNPQWQTQVTALEKEMLRISELAHKGITSLAPHSESPPTLTWISKTQRRVAKALGYL